MPLAVPAAQRARRDRPDRRLERAVITVIVATTTSLLTGVLWSALEPVRAVAAALGGG
jgi:hypothetical protein